MEINGGGSALHLACAPCILFCASLKGVETEGFLTTRGGWGSFPLYGGKTAWSQTCAMNDLRTKTSGGEACEGEGLGSRGSHHIIHVGICPFISSVFGTANRPNINSFGGCRPA